MVSTKEVASMASHNRREVGSACIDERRGELSRDGRTFVPGLLAKQNQQNDALSTDVVHDVCQDNCRGRCGCCCQAGMNAGRVQEGDAFCREYLVDYAEPKLKVFTLLPLRAVSTSRLFVLSWRKSASVLREPCFTLDSKVA